MDSTPPPYNRKGKSRTKAVSSPMALKDLLLLSPPPTRRSAKAADESFDTAGTTSRRRCNKVSRAQILAGCASPRNARRPRRRSSEVEDKDSLGFSRTHRSAKKDKLVLLSPTPSTKVEEETQGSLALDRMGQMANDLVMWTDVAKSSLWFGLGSLFFFSSCFSHGLPFSVFSVISKMGILYLVLCFFTDSMRQMNGVESKGENNNGVKEDDILRIARIVLPFANLAVSKMRELFSGDPSMTLKIAPLLLLGSEYGHIITLWRLCAIGFFFAFTVPKLYSFYSIQISQKVEQFGWRAFEAWESCPHKKVVAASAVTAFWNLSNIKIRIFTAFISLVLIRYCREHISQEIEDDNKVVAQVEDDNKVVAQEIEDENEVVAQVLQPQDKDPQEQQQPLMLEDCHDNTNH